MVVVQIKHYQLQRIRRPVSVSKMVSSIPGLRQAKHPHFNLNCILILWLLYLSHDN